MKLKGNHLYQLLLILLAPIFFSCQSLQPFYIDVLQPGKEQLPNNIQTLTIVSQAIKPNHNVINGDTLQKRFYKKNFHLDTVLHDKNMIDSSLVILGDLLYNSGRYGYVIPKRRFITPKPFSFLTGELDPDTVKNLCATYNTDAVLSLDFLKTKVSTNLSISNWWNDVKHTENEGYEANIQIIYHALYRIYSSDKGNVIYSNFETDTLNWTDFHPNVKTLFKNFITVKEALLETGVAISQKLAEKISNSWISQKRYFYTSKNSNFKQAAINVNNNEWEKAIKNWKQVAESKKSKSLRSKAYFNLALAYEVTGNINAALQAAYKSYKLKYSYLTSDYLKILKKRQNKINHSK